MSEAALAALAGRPWPGNVRELKNFIWRLAILSPGPLIDLADLALADPGALEAGPSGVEALLAEPGFREARADFEREYLRRKLLEHGGSVSLTAEAIGLERSHLYRKLRNLGLEVGKESD